MTPIELTPEQLAHLRAKRVEFHAKASWFYALTGYRLIERWYLDKTRLTRNAPVTVEEVLAAFVKELQ